ncbi:MAG: DPP IV N-terminal domain-containing protein, partial [Acidobacteria bacterium]|nr:DPP IV N-terminal domain-containing protein [Acidobacteriota bacterium]
MSPRITQSIIVGISLVLFAGQAPRPRATTLTIDQIMEGPDFAGTQPSEIRWSVDGHKVYFRWKTTSEKKAGLYTVDANGGVPRRLTDEEEKEAPPADGVENAARTRKVYVRDGDVYLLDLKNGARRRMTATVAEESNPGFTLDPDHLYFTRDNNLYLLSISTGVLEQLTDFRRGPAPRETKPTPSQKFLEDQQKELFKSVQEKAEDKKIEEEKKKVLERLKPFYLETRQSARALELAPDEKLVTFILDQEPEATKTTVVPEFVSETGYTADLRSRSKVGDGLRKNQLGIMAPAAKTDVVWVDHGQDKRGVIFANPVWSPDGKWLAVMSRAEDNKDRWISIIDTATGKTKILDSLHDDAWIGGLESRTLGWLPDSSAVYFVSEKTGYAHLYTATPDG